MKNAFLWAGILLALVVSCTVQDPTDINSPRHLRYFGVLEEDDSSTRMYADDQLRTLWNAGDYISIFEMNTFNNKYEFDGDDGDTAGGFSYVSGPTFGTENPLDHYVAVYPYRSSTKISNDEELTLVLPAEQTYRPNMYGREANTMVSKTELNEHGQVRFYFKYLCGVRKVLLYGEGITVSSVTFSAIFDETLAGKATVTVPEVDGVPVIKGFSNDESSVKLVCPEPVTLGSTKQDAVEFWFVLPPVTLSSGYTLTVTDVNGNEYQVSNPNESTIKRREVVKVGPVKVKASTVSVEQVQLDKHELELNAGEEATLVATVLPQTAPQAVTWSSSNETVATVSSNGVVTAVSPGTAVITVTTNTGGKTATCVVTVKEDAPVITYSLAIDPQSAEIKYGETQAFTLTLTTTTNGVAETQTVTGATWASSDEYVATVANGTATGTGAGTATITAKFTPEGSEEELSASASLTVTNVVSYSLAIDPTSAEIKSGETQAFTLTLTTTTNGVAATQTVTGATWASSDANVATVANGTATGIGAGTATITAKFTPEGSEEELSASASLKVTVDVITYSLAIDPESAEVLVGGTKAFTLTLTTTTNGEAATQTVTGATWTSSDANVATVANGTATGVAEGTVTITAKYTPEGSAEELTVTAQLTVNKDPNHAGDPVEIEEGGNL